MAENPSKSKLKRRKPAVEDVQSDTCSRGTQKKSHTSMISGDVTVSEAQRSGVPAGLWWSREQPPAVEALWALTMKSALPYLQNQHWDLVPELPEPSTARFSALKEDDLQWCDLREEVPPFPEPLPEPPSSPGPVRPSSSQQDLPVQTKPVPDSADPQLSSHSRRSLNIKKTCLQGKRGSDVVGKEERKVGRTDDRPSQLKASDRPVFMEEEGQNTKEEKRSEKGDGAAGGGAGGGGVLQSCPMCLLEFPVGFTQMDRDGHLAQCLSEVNADVTW